jgi:hypothetical protein
MRIESLLSRESVRVPASPVRKRGFATRRGGHSARTTKEVDMALLWLLVLLLVIFAIAGGVAINSFLWLVLVIALVVALVAMLT